MKRKFCFLINLIGLVIIILLTLKLTCKAESKVAMIIEKSNVVVGEEVTLNVEVQDASIAALTLWIYFDDEKLDYVSIGSNNTNVVGNRVIYTWYSETGKNQKLSNILEIKFKAAKDGNASFSMIGEIYNQNGEKLDFDYGQAEILIGNSQKEEKNGNAQNGSASDVEQNNFQNDTQRDASLEIMRVNREGINPNFDANITEYYLIVNEEVDKLDITAIPINSDAKVEISGNQNLKNGLNKVRIKVTSADGKNTREYVINVTKTNNAENANANLETLAIENYTLSPEFEKYVTNYYAEVSNKTEKLNILAIPSNFNATVHVQGNDNLKIGQNTVTITVTAVDGITKKNYYIDVYKRNEQEEIEYKAELKQMEEQANEILEEQENGENDSEIEESGEAQEDEMVKNKIFIMVGIVLSILVIGIVVIRIRKKI